MRQASKDRGDQAPEVPGNAADVGVHVQGVLEAAERAAAADVERARAEAERRVGEAKQRAQQLVDERSARIRMISDDLLRQVEDVEGKLTKLDAALGLALEDLRGELERLPEPPRDDDREDAEAANHLERTVLTR